MLLAKAWRTVFVQSPGAPEVAAPAVAMVSTMHLLQPALSLYRFHVHSTLQHLHARLLSIITNRFGVERWPTKNSASLHPMKIQPRDIFKSSSSAQQRTLRPFYMFWACIGSLISVQDDQNFI